MKECSNL